MLLAEHFQNVWRYDEQKPESHFSWRATETRRHHWPGNVRERNVLERALILEAMGEIQPGSLPDFQLRHACIKRNTESNR